MFDDGRAPLSRSFNENAKDDWRPALKRGFEAIEGGKEILELLDKQEKAEFERRHQEEIEETREKRFAEIVQAEVRKRGAAPEPGRRTHPMTPAEYAEIKRAGEELCEQQTEQMKEQLRLQIEEQTRQVGERMLDRLQQQQRMGQQQGRSMGRDDL